jgi:adenosylhomocysteine nucleosidase
MRTLVCFAVKEEATTFRKRMAGRADVSIIVTGMGRKHAEKAVRDFLAVNAIELVLTCGFAGGLNPDFAPGAVLFSTTHRGLAGRLRTAGAKSATILCANHIAVTALEKQQLRTTTGADVVEMESEAIQTVCREQGVPCATVRVISDTAHEDLPLDFNQLYRPDMSLDFGKLMWTIAKSPGKIGALMRLQKRCQFAAEQLAAVLVTVV